MKARSAVRAKSASICYGRPGGLEARVSSVESSPGSVRAASCLLGSRSDQVRGGLWCLQADRPGEADRLCVMVEARN